MLIEPTLVHTCLCASQIQCFCGLASFCRCIVVLFTIVIQHGGGESLQ